VRKEFVTKRGETGVIRPPAPADAAAYRAGFLIVAAKGIYVLTEEDEAPSVEALTERFAGADPDRAEFVAEVGGTLTGAPQRRAGHVAPAGMARPGYRYTVAPSRN
jgi:hypothetical protein